MRTKLVACFLGLAALAQMAAGGVVPEMMVKNRFGAVENRLEIEACQVVIERVHDQAKVDFTLVFRNSSSQQLEGEFTMPLPPGAVVTGYALDVNGVMREGVAVPREKARIAYETIKAANTDPGYVEREEGNVYRTKIFPILANSTKAVRLTWIQAMEQGEDGLHLRLPFNHDVKVGKFEATLLPGAGAPAKSIDCGGLDFTEEKPGVWEAESPEYLMEKAWHLVFPSTPLPSLAIEQGGDRHFHLVDDAPTPPAPPAPTGILVIWDVSSSRLDVDVEKDLAVIDALARVVPKAKWEAVLLGDMAKPISGDIATLRKRLTVAPRDGWADWSKVPAVSADRILVFTDLAPVSCRQSLPELPGMVIVTHAPPPRSNHGIPRGVPVFSHATHAPEAVIAKLLTPILKVELLTPTPCPAIEYPEMVWPGERIRITGRVEGETTGWALRYSLADKVLIERPVMKAAAFVPYSPMARNPLSTLQALAVQARLEDMPVRDEAALLKHEMDNGLVGEETSLIVLETLEHYVQYRIPPPEPEMLARYQMEIRRKSDDQPSPQNALFGAWTQRMHWRTRDWPWLDELLQPRLTHHTIWAHAMRRAFEPGQYNAEFLKASEAWKAKALELIAEKNQHTTAMETRDWAERIAKHAQAGHAMENQKAPAPARDTPVAVSVQGAVPKKGVLNLKAPATLWDAMWRSGFRRERGFEEWVDLYRNGRKQTIYRENYVATLLQPGDMIVVEPLGTLGGAGGIDPFGGGADFIGSPERRPVADNPWGTEPEKPPAASEFIRTVVAYASPSPDAIKSALAGRKDGYAAYLRLMGGKRHGADFYVEAARILSSSGQMDAAVRVLGNLRELPGPPFVREREYAHVLWTIGARETAEALLAELGKSPEEKALVLLDRAHFRIAAGKLAFARPLLLAVADDETFPTELRASAVAMLNTIPHPEREPMPELHQQHRFYCHRMDSDIRMVLILPDPSSTVRFGVEEPFSPPEICRGYSRVGGRVVSKHGISEYQIARALPGVHRAMVWDSKAGYATLFLFTNWGKENQTCAVHLVSMGVSLQDQEIGKLVFELPGER